MRIGIFGGSFNPPHKVHENIATYLLDHDYVDKIIFVPTGSKYKYKHNLISDKDRYNMINIIAKKRVEFAVSDYDLKDYPVYTYQTLRHFSALYPDDEIYFICGSDNLSYIDSWENALEILTNYKILVIKREGDDIDKILEKLTSYRENIIITGMVETKLSSTMIRDKVFLNLENALDKDVYLYIVDNELYGYEKDDKDDKS